LGTDNKKFTKGVKKIRYELQNFVFCWPSISVQFL